jgi:hypothetical protein
MTTLPLALAAALALGAEPPPERGPLAARGDQIAAIVLGGCAALATADAVWGWSGARSYDRFWLAGDPGPLVFVPALFTPYVAPPVAAASGALYLSALGRERGVGYRVPAWYWLGLAPMVTTFREMAIRDAEAGYSPRARRVIAGGTAASFAWFAGATAFLAWRFPDGPSPHAGPGAVGGVDVSVEPLAVQAPRGSVRGLALRGRF